jgi:hypothetical protein
MEQTTPMTEQKFHALDQDMLPHYLVHLQVLDVFLMNASITDAKKIPSPYLCFLRIIHHYQYTNSIRILCFSQFGPKDTSSYINNSVSAVRCSGNPYLWAKSTATSISLLKLPCSSGILPNFYHQPAKAYLVETLFQQFE